MRPIRPNNSIEFFPASVTCGEDLLGLARIAVKRLHEHRPLDLKDFDDEYASSLAAIAQNNQDPAIRISAHQLLRSAIDGGDPKQNQRKRHDLVTRGLLTDLVQNVRQETHPAVHLEAVKTFALAARTIPAASINNDVYSQVFGVASRENHVAARAIAYDARLAIITRSDHPLTPDHMATLAQESPLDDTREMHSVVHKTRVAAMRHHPKMITSDLIVQFWKTATTHLVEEIRDEAHAFLHSLQKTQAVREGLQLSGLSTGSASAYTDMPFVPEIANRAQNLLARFRL